MKFYTCEKCGFVFTRTGECDTCPSCDEKSVRNATDKEAAELTAKLKMTSKNEANN